MQKNYKLIISIVALAIASIGLGVFAQSEAEYKDVILDGKPAKLNVATGEITLVNQMTKTKASKFNEDVYYSENPSDYHIVQESESLLDISRKYNVSLTKLKDANHLESTLINQGQRLQVKNFDVKKEPTEHSHTHSTVVEDSEIITSNFHIVVKDETLYSLSRRYNLSLIELKLLNNLDSNLIVIGQKLRLNDYETNNEVDNFSVWTVKIDDTLYSIALKTGISVVTIKQLNELTSNLIIVGQKLRLK